MLGSSHWFSASSPSGWQSSCRGHQLLRITRLPEKPEPNREKQIPWKLGQLPKRKESSSPSIFQGLNSLLVSWRRLLGWKNGFPTWLFGDQLGLLEFNLFCFLGQTIIPILIKGVGFSYEIFGSLTRMTQGSWSDSCFKSSNLWLMWSNSTRFTISKTKILGPP